MKSPRPREPSRTPSEVEEMREYYEVEIHRLKAQIQAQQAQAQSADIIEPR